MKNPSAVLALIAATALAACASQPTQSYPAATTARPTSYDKATPCCDDPSGFHFGGLPKQGYADAVVDSKSPVFDFQSGLSPFAAFVLPDASTPYRVRVKSLFDRKDGGKSGVFYPVVALLDDAFIVVHITGLESLRLEPALATAGGESGLAVRSASIPPSRKASTLSSSRRRQSSAGHRTAIAKATCCRSERRRTSSGTARRRFRRRPMAGSGSRSRRTAW